MEPRWFTRCPRLVLCQLLDLGSYVIVNILREAQDERDLSVRAEPIEALIFSLDAALGASHQFHRAFDRQCYHKHWGPHRTSPDACNPSRGNIRAIFQQLNPECVDALFSVPIP